MTTLVGLSKYAMAQQRIHMRQLLRRRESIIARNNAERRESTSDALRNGRARKGMRERLGLHVVFEGDVRGFIGGDQREDERGIVRRCSFLWHRYRAPQRRCSSLFLRHAQNDKMSFGAVRRVALPSSKGRQIVSSASHVSV